MVRKVRRSKSDTEWKDGNGFRVDGRWEAADWACIDSEINTSIGLRLDVIWVLGPWSGLGWASDDGVSGMDDTLE